MADKKCDNNLLTMDTIYCPTCQQHRTEDDFHKDVNRIEGLCEKCRWCRANEYHARKNPDEKPCNCCGLQKKRAPNGACVKCNKEDGLKWCQSCNYVLPEAMCFYPKRSTCRECETKPVESL